MFKKCNKCGNIVYVINNSNNMLCCNEEMKILTVNSVDASLEKHMPNVNKDHDKVKVTVNHVMEDDHYIEWIAQECNDEIIIKRLKPGMEAIVKFKYINDAVIYAYCNKHGLWQSKVIN